LVAGVFGTQETIHNFAPTFVWIVWWVGLAYVAALLGNPWPAVNPFAILFRWAEAAFGWATGGRSLALGLPYPAWLGAWPAALLFAAFAWFELIAPSAKSPAALAAAIAGYAGLTWAAMWVFGRAAWLGRGEAFTLAFDVFGRFAPLGTAPDPGTASGPQAAKAAWGLYLRPYAGALVTSVPAPLSMTAFVLLMLSTVTFDGFKETPLWGVLLRGLTSSPLLHPLIRVIHDAGLDLHETLASLLLFTFPVAFLLVYLLFALMTKRAAASPRPVTEVAGLFVWSLVPIAIAYHLAHYLSYLVLAGQYIIPLISDPFGAGWDLFGTARHKVDIGLIGAEFVWNAAVVSIVAGHVIAVGVAHFTALRVFDSPRAALRSQYPLLVLMVGYTVASLWILSQPITGTGDVARLEAPAGSVTLASFEFRERCLDLKPGDGIVYEYEADRAIDFDIHYHDGLTTRFAAVARAQKAGDGTFTPKEARRYCLFWFNPGLTKASLTYRITGPRPDPAPQ
ncbi:MAG: hypothetical protein OEO83_08145, partial [Alphaproteobacteria bacterium]|nr:hypothetical protein [Alphaproteobacteria bacterium]